MFLQCEICENILAKTDPSRLRTPITTAMFDAPYPEYNNPWPWHQTWLEMFCPYCGSRPFVMTEKEIQDSLEYRTEGPTRIKTPNGWFNVGDKYEPGQTPEREVHVYDDDQLEREWKDRVSGVPAGVVEEMNHSDLKPIKRGRPRKVKS